MLGNAPISGVALSSQASSASVLSASGIGVFSAVGASIAEAVLSSVGQGQFSAVGAATAAAVLLSSGAGSFSAVGTGINTSVLSAQGIGTLTAIGTSITESVWSSIGIGQFHAYTVFPTPPQRTLTVPFRSRVLVLSTRDREQAAPATSRAETVLRTSRSIVVPLYPRIVN